MKIVPFSALQAKVEIESSDIGFVRVGRPADISIDSFPATDFGVLLGTVKGIGSDALPPDERNQTYRFPATIALDTPAAQAEIRQEPAFAGGDVTHGQYQAAQGDLFAAVARRI